MGFMKMGVDSVFAVNAWAAPLLLLPLCLTDAQGRRWVGGKTGLCIFGVGVSTILAFLITVNWHLVAPYAETSCGSLQSVFNGSFSPLGSHFACLFLGWLLVQTLSAMLPKV
jgi:hypothetical protein